MSWLGVLIAAAGGVDLTPILVAVIAALSGSGFTAWLTIKRTNKKLEAEAELIYQQALDLADTRAAKNVETMERITRTLSERLEATEKALEMAHRRVEEQEAKIRELSTRSDLVAAEKDKAIIAAEAEREKLQRRILDLEERVADLLSGLHGRRGDAAPRRPSPPAP